MLLQSQALVGVNMQSKSQSLSGGCLVESRIGAAGGT